MNIVLIGMRGSGKTTVGKILAQKTGRELIEMDELIARRAGLTIPHIVEKYGWERFRDIEEELTIEVARRDNIINATGGGVVTSEQNIIKLKKNGIVAWLTAGVDTLSKRIGEDNNRPLLKGKTQREDMEITLAERQPLYQQAADIIVDTEDKTPEAIAETIANTKICCLIGDPVEHSLSPLIHNAGYKALGINFAYITSRASDIERAIESIRARGIRGASVTTPHKASALKCLDRLDPPAEAIGAVNTIVNENGILTGYNTDGEGALKALEETTALGGKRAVLVGSGGAALAIATALKENGVKLVILNRTESKARQLANKVESEDAGGLGKISLVASADILINATPVGMSPKTKETIIPKELLHEHLTVFDIVYNPRDTRLLVEAREKGCNIVCPGRRELCYAF
ncbi:Shikimate dehydrogenase (NADP(+)) [subsurface metagenome]